MEIDDDYRIEMVTADGCRIRHRRISDSPLYWKPGCRNDVMALLEQDARDRHVRVLEILQQDSTGMQVLVEWL